MSYITNTTANRLKFNKGWKNPSFPETLPLYSRDNVFFFKLYLFLKAYFTLKRTRLVYCDLRNSENYTKILSLVINSVPKKFKKKKSYRTWYVRKTSSGLKYSPFRNAQISHAVNLLYLDLPKLKQQVSAKLLPLSKQKINKAFYSKTRYKSWINFLAKIKGVRNNNKFYIKHKNLNFAPINFHKLNIEQSLHFKLKRLKNQIIVLNRFFTTLKQQQTLTKHNIILYKTQLIRLKKQFTKLNTIISKYNLQKNIDQFKINSKNLRKIHKKKPKAIKKFLHKKRRSNITLNYTKKISENLNPKKKLKIKRKLISKNLLNKRLIFAKKILNSRTKISLQNYKIWTKTVAIARIKKTQFLLKLNSFMPTRFLKKSVNNIKLYKKIAPQKLYTSILNLKKNKHAKITLKEKKPHETYGYIKKKKKKKLTPTILNNKMHQQLIFNNISAYTTYFKNSNKINTYKTITKFLNLLKAKSLVKNNTSLKNILISNNHNKNNLSYPTAIKTIKLAKRRRARRGGRNKFAFALLRKIRLKKKINSVARTFSENTIKRTVNTQNVFALVQKFEKGYKQLIEKDKIINENKKKTSVWKLRESFRNKYKKHTTTLIKYQYKLALQKVLLNFFKMHFEVKIIRPLTQFKNLKLLRLVYPLRRFDRNSKKKQILFKKNLRKLNIKTLPQPINNANKAVKAKDNKNIKAKAVKQNTKEIKKTKSNEIFALRKRYILMGNRTKRFAKRNKRNTKSVKKNTYVFRKSANKFKRLRRQELINFSQQRLFSVRRNLMMHSFMPMASLFIKYLNPQLLADHIAKEFEKTKHHKNILYALSNALRALPFARAKGYRISIVGRINSASKSRSYLLKRNVFSRQTFSTKVNFASSQAKARIGAFGIKVWIFY